MLIPDAAAAVEPDIPDIPLLDALRACLLAVTGVDPGELEPVEGGEWRGIPVAIGRGSFLANDGD